MKLHLLPDGVVDPDAFERETLAEIGMPKEMAMRHRLPQFNHLFSSRLLFGRLLQLPLVGGDGRRHLGGVRGRRQPVGPGDRAEVQDDHPGDRQQTDRAEAYRQFRGRDPDVNALLKNRGFPVAGGSDKGRND